MAIARKCDACGKLYDGYKGCIASKRNYNGIKLCYTEPGGVNILYESARMDLCPDCMQKLIELITPSCVEKRKGRVRNTSMNEEIKENDMVRADEKMK